MDSILLVGTAPEIKAKLSAISSDELEIGIRKMSLIELNRLNGFNLRITITYTYAVYQSGSTTWTVNRPAIEQPINLQFVRVYSVNDLIFNNTRALDMVSDGGISANNLPAIHYWSVVSNENYTIYVTGPIRNVTISFTGFENILPSQSTIFNSIPISQAINIGRITGDYARVSFGTANYVQPYIGYGLTKYITSLPIFPKIRLPIVIKSSLPISSLTNRFDGAVNALDASINAQVYEPQYISFKQIAYLNNFSIYFPSSVSKTECAIQLVTKKASRKLAES